MSNILAPKVWDVSTKTLKRTFGAKGQEIASVTFAHSDQIVISLYSEAQYIHTWNVEGGLLGRIKVHDVQNVVGSPYHPFFIAVGLGKLQAAVYDAERNGRNEGIVLSKSARAAVFTSDGSMLITGCEGGSLATWDLKPLLERQAQTLDEAAPGSLFRYDDSPESFFRDDDSSESFLQDEIDLMESFLRGGSRNFPWSTRDLLKRKSLVTLVETPFGNSHVGLILSCNNGKVDHVPA